MVSFWNTLTKPFLALAPMEDVTDTVFRQIVAGCARPDVFFTEFVNVEGMFARGQDVVRQRLKFTDHERPIVAQIWGTKAEYFYRAATELVKLGFDGVDLNFGCPVKAIVKKGACAALIENPALAKEIIQATKEGAKNLPVSVKTRIGYNSIVTEDWIGFLLEENLDALAIHGRTAREMSVVPAHWDEIRKVVTLRDKLKVKTLIIGNGDVLSAAEAAEKSKTYGVDGVMIGRGILHNPWVFERSGRTEMQNQEKKFELLIKHVKLFENTWGTAKPFAVLKKYFKIYIQGFPGASELRTKLMATKSTAEVEQIITEQSRKS